MQKMADSKTINIQQQLSAIQSAVVLVPYFPKTGHLRVESSLCHTFLNGAKMQNLLVRDKTGAIFNAQNVDSMISEIDKVRSDLAILRDAMRALDGAEDELAAQNLKDRGAAARGEPDQGPVWKDPTLCVFCEGTPDGWERAIAELEKADGLFSVFEQDAYNKLQSAIEEGEELEMPDGPVDYPAPDIPDPFADDQNDEASHEVWPTPLPFTHTVESLKKCAQIVAESDSDAPHKTCWDSWAILSHPDFSWRKN